MFPLVEAARQRRRHGHSHVGGRGGRGPGVRGRASGFRAHSVYGGLCSHRGPEQAGQEEIEGEILSEGGATGEDRAGQAARPWCKNLTAGMAAGCIAIACLFLGVVVEYGGTLELVPVEVFSETSLTGWCSNLGCEVDVPYGFEVYGQLSGSEHEECEDCEGDEDEGEHGECEDCGCDEDESGVVFDDGWCEDFGHEVEVHYGFEEDGLLSGSEAEECDECEGDDDVDFVAVVGGGNTVEWVCRPS